jgi:hypothetical protein
VIICRGCRQSFISSLAPVADLCSELSRAEAAVPEHGRNAGVARPLRSSTGHRLRGGDRVPKAYLVELDEGVDLLTPRR